jgi:hypothetical protein
MNPGSSPGQARIALIRQNPVTTKDTKDTKEGHIQVEEGPGVGSQREA